MFTLRHQLVYISRMIEVWSSKGRGDTARSRPIGRVNRKTAVFLFAVLWSQEGKNCEKSSPFKVSADRKREMRR
jgi:hypothetical protein